jgi:hypothetical protein
LMEGEKLKKQKKDDERKMACLGHWNRSRPNDILWGITRVDQ